MNLTTGRNPSGRLFADRSRPETPPSFDTAISALDCHVTQGFCARTRPALVAGAAAAATLLNLFHPFDAAASDLAIHAIAVVAVIAVIRLFGARALGAKKNFAARCKLASSSTEVMAGGSDCPSCNEGELS